MQAMASLSSLDSYSPSGGYSTRSPIPATSSPLSPGYTPGVTAGTNAMGTNALPAAGQPGGTFSWWLAVIILAFALKFLSEEKTDLLNPQHLKISLYNIVAVWISFKLADPLVKVVTNAVPAPAGLKAFINA